MAEDLDSRYRRILGKQLVMNEETWRTLRGHGVSESTELRLDFRYDAPDRANAESLETLLKEQTDYDVRVRSVSSELRTTWMVEGTTQPTTLSAQILDQWVDWMVSAGLQHDCEFDGWGTQVR